MAGTWEELTSAQATLSADIEAFGDEVAARAADWAKSGNGPGRDNAALHEAREGLHDISQRCRDLTRQIDLAAKLAGRVIDVRREGTRCTGIRPLGQYGYQQGAQGTGGRTGRGRGSTAPGTVFCETGGLAAGALPEAELRDVEGLVKLVGRAEIEEHDWSLTPGRYVGVAPEEKDEDFDFEEALRSIHIDLQELNDEAMGTGGANCPKLRGVGSVTLRHCSLGEVMTLKRGHDLPEKRNSSGRTSACCLVSRE